MFPFVAGVVAPALGIAVKAYIIGDKVGRATGIFEEDDDVEGAEGIGEFVEVADPIEEGRLLRLHKDEAGDLLVNIHCLDLVGKQDEFRGLSYNEMLQISEKMARSRGCLSLDDLRDRDDNK